MKQAPDNRVTITHGRATYRVQPANAQRLRDTLFKLERAKPARPKVPKADSTGFPQFTPGMSTGEYVRQFQKLNYSGDPVEFPRLKFAYADRVAPMLDPLVPEVLEEPDADYVAPTVAAKVKRPKAADTAHLKALLLEAVSLMPGTHAGAEWTARALEVAL